jgi:hypothetical protein
MKFDDPSALFALFLKRIIPYNDNRLSAHPTGFFHPPETMTPV